jgi:hypothetical protein
MSDVLRMSWEAGLVEAAVLAVERLLPHDERARFRRERDRVYSAPGDEREDLFDELHGRWFRSLGLDRPLREAMADETALLGRVAGCRVVGAVARRHERADVFDEPAVGTAPVLVVRVCPDSLLDADGLLGRLRHELLHAADMLDPAFGYQRDLPYDAGGPAADALLRRRYHAVWDATIDGRLFRRGRLDEGARPSLERDFARCLPGLGTRALTAYRRWFDEPRPTHPAILAFAAEAGRAALCPSCGLPTLRLMPTGECPRCAEVLEQRSESQEAWGDASRSVVRWRL